MLPIIYLCMVLHKFLTGLWGKRCARTLWMAPMLYIHFFFSNSKVRVVVTFIPLIYRWYCYIIRPLYQHVAYNTSCCTPYASITAMVFVLGFVLCFNIELSIIIFSKFDLYNWLRHLRGIKCNIYLRNVYMYIYRYLYICYNLTVVEINFHAISTQLNSVLHSIFNYSFHIYVIMSIYLRMAFCHYNNIVLYTHFKEREKEKEHTFL